MKGLTLNSMPGVLAGPMGAGKIESPIKKRRKKMQLATASGAGKSGGMSGIGMPQLPFGGALNK